MNTGADRLPWRPIAASTVFAMAGCAINPVTGERELTLISEEQEISMGREAAQQAQQSLGLVVDDSLQQYVGNIGQKLAQSTERQALPWEFHVIDDPAPNAFALPGGFIFVTRGLINLMSSEAELAAVLGHEIGHVTARHSVVQLSRAQLAQLGLNLGMILSPELRSVSGAAGAGLNLLFLKYGRDDERQADELGFRYMLDHGYDVREMENVFSALQNAGMLAGQSPLPSWLSSHPSEPERIEAVRERVASLAPPTANLRTDSQEYLEHLDGLVYGENPREGFFRDGRFYHPELIFEFEAPESWQRQNLRALVAGSSPEGDAGLQLTMVQNLGPEEAARQFFAQQAVAAVASSPQRLNGNSAVFSEFQAQTQNGLVRGYVAHIAHGGTTYQLIAYAAGTTFPQYARVLERIAGSFGPLRDENVLDIEPRRLSIEPLPRDMSLAEFQQVRPSSIPIEELAVLNQVDDISASLPRGTPVKRVIGDEVS